MERGLRKAAKLGLHLPEKEGPERGLHWGLLLTRGWLNKSLESFALCVGSDLGLLLLPKIGSSYRHGPTCNTHISLYVYIHVYMHIYICIYTHI